MCPDFIAIQFNSISQLYLKTVQNIAMSLANKQTCNSYNNYKGRKEITQAELFWYQFNLANFNYEELAND